MQDGSSSYIGALAGLRAFCEEMDLSVGREIVGRLRHSLHSLLYRNRIDVRAYLRAVRHAGNRCSRTNRQLAHLRLKREQIHAPVNLQPSLGWEKSNSLSKDDLGSTQGKNRQPPPTDNPLSPWHWSSHLLKQHCGLKPCSSYWFEPGSNLISGLFKVLRRIKSRP